MSDKSDAVSAPTVICSILPYPKRFQDELRQPATPPGQPSETEQKEEGVRAIVVGPKSIDSLADTAVF